uniref:Uncharacterized protein n=1 Tax=Nothobranchius furzeri TaxID=105023 RepID=A0A1A8A113_NOTFU
MTFTATACSGSGSEGCMSACSSCLKLRTSFCCDPDSGSEKEWFGAAATDGSDLLESALRSVADPDGGLGPEPVFGLNGSGSVSDSWVQLSAACRYLSDQQQNQQEVLAGLRPDSEHRSGRTYRDSFPVHVAQRAHFTSSQQKGAVSAWSPVRSGSDLQQQLKEPKHSDSPGAGVLL